MALPSDRPRNRSPWPTKPTNRTHSSHTQPNPTQLFDRLHLLSDGQTIFFGPTQEAVGYFEQAGFRCPPLWNAADFLLDLIATDYRTAEAEKETKARIAGLYLRNMAREGMCTCSYDYAALAVQAEAAGQGGRWTVVRACIRTLAMHGCRCVRVYGEQGRALCFITTITITTATATAGPPAAAVRGGAALHTGGAAGTLRGEQGVQLAAAVWPSRVALGPGRAAEQGNDLRQGAFRVIGGASEHVHAFGAIITQRQITPPHPYPPTDPIQFGISALLGLLVGLMYSNMGHDQQSIYDRKGVLFFVTINQAFGLITTVCGTFPKERKIVLRERCSNSYHISAYYLAKVWMDGC